MADPAAQPNLQPTDYNYFLDNDGDVWRQPTEGGLYEVMAPGSWEVLHPDRRLVLRPLILGKPTLPTEPGLYLVNYSEDRPLLNHSMVYLARDGAEWRYYADDVKWNPRGGDTLTRLDVVEGEK
jgi:hypothetical protein